MRDAVERLAISWRGPYNESVVRSRLPVHAKLCGFSCTLVYGISGWDDSLSTQRGRFRISVSATVRWRHERIRVSAQLRHIRVS